VTTDSMGNSGYIGPGDVQWMTQAPAFIHEEMPPARALWALRGSSSGVKPACLQPKRWRFPPYRGFSASEILAQKIPGGEARVIAGSFAGAHGPVQGLPASAAVHRLRLGSEGSATVDAPRGETAFACVLRGLAGVAGRSRRRRHAAVLPSLRRGRYGPFKAGQKRLLADLRLRPTPPRRHSLGPAPS